MREECSISINLSRKSKMERSWFVLVLLMVLRFPQGLTKIPKARNTLSGLENSPLTRVMGVVGGRAVLPCDLTPPVRGDSTHLVLFYHNGTGTPIYSLDSRSVSLEEGTHWTVAGLEGRVYLQLEGEETRRGRGRGLVVENLEEGDRGEYRCRVDFLHSPTRYSRIKLDVVAPPRRLSITTDRTQESTNVAGPYLEGESASLTCHVFGGQPRPQVTWWHEGSLMDDNSEVTTDLVTRNTLTLPAVTRADLNKTLTCQAANSDLTFPLSASITILLHFPPSAVRLMEVTSQFSSSDEQERIIGGQITVEVGVVRAVVCEVEGSQPPPVISWFRNNQRWLQTTQDSVVEVEGRQIWRSTLEINAVPEDDRSVITCRAHTPLLTHLALQDHVTLNVLYKPHLKLDPGVEVDLEDLQEGDDVSFVCEADANPPVTGIQWAHNGVPVQDERVDGDSSLVLRGVTSDSAGTYTCAAANSQGATTSSPVHVAVKYPPRCSEGQQKIYGVARLEILHLPCRVAAYPAPTSFRWAVNTSMGVIDLPQNLSSIHGRSSILTYAPNTRHHFGDILCWAHNDVGMQRDPCVFNLLPAGKPDSVRECVAQRNSTMPVSYAVVSCLPGWDGGLNQSFTLEVRQKAMQEVLDEFSHAARPFFIIRGLKLGVEYLLTVTAANSRGTSKPVTITYTAYSAAADKVVSPHVHDTLLSITPFLVLLVGLVAAVGACVGVCVLIAKKQRGKTGAEVLYAGTVKGDQDDEVHTIICVNKDCEKSELVKLTRTAPGNFFVNSDTVVNSTMMGNHETDVLLQHSLLTPTTFTDSLGRCSTVSSICTSSSKTPSSRSSHSSFSTVALNPDYTMKTDTRASSSSIPTLVALPKESSV